MKTKNVADEVLRAALELFAEQGYANTSVQQIVQAAGVTKGAMYHYFTSKDDLLFAIYERMLSLQKRRLDEIMAAGGDTESVLRAVCEDVVVTSIDFLPEGTVFFRSQHMLTPERQAEVKRRRREYHDKFAELIVRGQEEKLFRDDVPVSVLIAHFFSDIHYLPHWYSHEGPENEAELAAQITELFLRSLRRNGG
ncbi:TetR/AcrR family transcriptional regulator [Glycomyces albidus]|jgi:AcrR family transcriptional regulator|uniref:TetR family transcriptional regulator n=1 Tax=Glycomyces albidus TaxID=2656774 RepID=A0A6L5GAK3_9ACTN|nr:TetR/AcrR family transcriptional regulator [Glycomyces albidus]MQM26685.1 TetR family transcriptional regulator [Glycomyces albidus]